ncbi:MAG TPA: PAS domain S-box protein [Gammaproteobacteria bacterium]|nr:PAS domain S-box protein [Gammaproteobacteria bacterium]
MISTNQPRDDDSGRRSSERNAAVDVNHSDVARGDRSSILHRMLRALGGVLSLRYAQHLLLFTVSYWFTGELGLLVGSGYEDILPLWPSAGLTLFAFLVAGPRVWPGVLLGSQLLVHTENVPWVSMLIVAGGHVVEAMLGYAALHRSRADFKYGMQRIKDVLMLTGCAAVGATLIGSMLGTFALAASGLVPWNHAETVWFTWWLSDAVGIIVVTPLLLVWRHWRRVRLDLRKVSELIALLGVVGVTAWTNFYLIAGYDLHLPLVLYLMLPFAIWAAARFHQYGATLVAMLVCVVMLWGTQHGYGAFAPYSDLNRLLLSIFYIAVTAFTALSVAALFVERLHTEKALFASREQFRTLVSTMNQGLVVQNKDGVVTYANDRFCEIVGYEREEIVGKPVTAHIDEINQALWLELVSARRFDKPDPYEPEAKRNAHRVRPYELEVKRKDGRKIYLQVSPHLIFDETGEPVGSFVVYTDITRRRRIETTLNGRREVLERLAMGAPLNEVLTILAQTAEETRADTCCAVMVMQAGKLKVGAAPSLPEYYVDALQGIEFGDSDASCAVAACTGARMIVEDVLTHPYWYAYRRLAQRAGVRACWSEPIVSSHGEILGAFVMYHREPRRPEQSDLQFMAATASLAAVAIEQRRKEQALKQSEARFRQLAEHIRDVFWMIDADGTPCYVSPAYERVWGRSLQSLYNNPRSWIEAIHLDDRKLIGPGYLNEVPTEDTEQEYRIIQPDGSIRWIRDRAFAIRDEAGEVYRVAGIAEDVTEHKRAERLARKHRDELAHMARLSSVGEMASSLAHELNQPLGAVANYCSAALRLLRSGTDDIEKVRRALEKATVQAQRAGEIIHHIRDFLRKDTRRRAYIGLNDIVREAVRLTEPEIHQKRGSIRLDLCEGLPRVMGDRIQLEQVILNLLRNGMEAMVHCNAVPRQLIVYSRFRDERTVQVSVRDNGIGLDQESLSHIFDPFYTTKSEGMGMGLPISRSIIEAHAGHLWAETLSPPARGTVFHFTLPISQERAA